MAQPPHKHYFVKTDPTFVTVLQWMTAELGAGRLGRTGYRRIQLDRIYSNDCVNNMAWRREYDFSRTTAVTLRYLMLTVTGILGPGLFDHNTLSQPALGRVVTDLQNPQQIVREGVEMNAGGLLANTRVEAEWVSAHFDMLFPHFHIENRIHLSPLPVVSMGDEMIVVNIASNTVWDFIITLSITRLPDIQHKKVFNALPIIIVYRLESHPSMPLMNYPFASPNAYDVAFIESRISHAQITT